MSQSSLDEFRASLRQFDKKSKSRRFRNALKGAARPRLPWGAFIRVAFLFFMLKGFIMMEIGERSYRDRLSAIADPTPGQMIGKFFMHPDPVTVQMHEALTLLQSDFL